MAASAAFINNMLDDAFTGTFTMALFKTGLPSTTGVEITGGGYTRETVSFSAATGKEKATSADITFANLPTGNTIVAWGIYEGATLVDEKLLDVAFTPDVTNNELNVSYKFSLAGV